MCTRIMVFISTTRAAILMRRRRNVSNCYPRDVELVFPVAGRGRPRKRHVPKRLSATSEDVLKQAKWRTITWRRGTKGPLQIRFALRVRVADGPPQRIGDKGMQLRMLAATIKARWVCEQAHQQLKEELGLDHFEGRAWQGLVVTR
jgi:SRSO17 transposase